MRCAICKKECGRTICSERCRSLLADKVAAELARRESPPKGQRKRPSYVTTKNGGNRWKAKADAAEFL